MQNHLSNNRLFKTEAVLSLVPPNIQVVMSTPLELEYQGEQIKESRGQSIFDTLFSLLLPLKSALAILIYNSFDLISSVNKLPTCMSQTFTKVVSSLQGLSYSAVSMESTKLYWRPYCHQSPSVLASGRKPRESLLLSSRIDDVSDHIVDIVNSLNNKTMGTATGDCCWHAMCVLSRAFCMRTESCV